MNQKENIKIVTDNRKASYDYFLEDRYEAGLVLQGTEIKKEEKNEDDGLEEKEVIDIKEI